MKVDENQLREVLRLAIADIDSKPRTVLIRLKDMMWQMFGFTPGETASIVSGKIPVELMQRDTMFKITRVLHELMQHIDTDFNFRELEVEKYFTEKECDEYSIKIDRSQADEEIVITQWNKVADDQYSCVISSEDIYNWVNQNKVQYNPETQRDMEIKETKNGTIKVVKVFPEALKEIVESMKSGNYISDALTFNINIDKYLPPKETKAGLVIPKESVIDCIDGFHRLNAMTLVRAQDSEWQQNFVIILTLFDKNKAVKYILQQDKKNHLSDKQVTESDQNDAANFIIEKLNKPTSNFYLKGSLSVIIYTLNKIISKTFKTKRMTTSEDIQETVKLYNYIEKNLNELIEDKNYFGKEFSKSEWFIYLNVLSYCREKDMNFVETINKLPIDKLMNEINITNEPILKHFRIISEVIKNV